MEAYEAALTAADRAERERRFDQALHAFERAIEITSLVPDVGLLVGPGPAALLERAAEVAHLAGEHRRASQLLRLATDALPKEPGATDGDRVAVHPRLVRYLIASGDLGEALRAVEQPIAPGQIRVGDQASTAAARADALLRAGRYAESQREAEHASALARHTGDRVREADAWSTLGFDIAVLGESEAAIAALERAREIAEELGQPEGIGRADLNLAELLSGPLGRMDDAIDVAEAGVRRASKLGLGRSYGVALQAVAINTRFRLGRWTDTEHLLDPPFDLDPTGAAALDLYLARTKLYVGQGDFNAALDDLDAVEALAAGSVGPRYRVAHADAARRPGDVAAPSRLRAALAIAEALDDEIIFSDPWLLAPVLWHGLHAEGDIVQQAWSRRSEHEVAEDWGAPPSCST